MKVAIYCRVGSQSQLSEERIERQSEILKVFAQNQGHTVECAVFEYRSGLDLRCDGLKKILDIAESGKVDAVLVEDISQIGCDFFKTHEYLGHLRKHNVRLLQANVLKRLL
jgi:DNA invertase Pin-like site-specific DNA recombinase